MPPRAGPGQLAALADLLADVSPYASLSFERLLADMARRAPAGSSIIALSSRDPIEFVPTLRRLRAQGYAVTVAAFGPDAGVSCARARSARRAECRISTRSRLADRRCARTRRLSASRPCSRPPLLEAAWVTLVYVLVQSLTGPAEAPLSMLAFAGAALAGIAFTHLAARGRRFYRAPLAAIAIAVALIGWLLPLGEAATGVVSEPGSVFGMHPGGILLGLAFLRGTAHATRLDDERIAEFALGPGLAAIAGLWVFLTVSGGTAEAWVVGAASSATVTFITAGLLSVGLARLADLRGSGVRGADRRIWDGVLLAVVIGLLAISLPLAVILGVPLGGALRGAVQVVTAVLVVVAIPFIWVGAALGWVLYLAIEFLRGLAGGHSTDTGGVIGGPLVDWQGMLGPGGQNGLALGVIPLVVALVIAFILISRAREAAAPIRGRRRRRRGSRSRASDRDAAPPPTAADAATARRPAFRE